MNTPYYHTATSSYWWSRSKSSPKLTKDKPRETTLSRTHSALQADGLAPDRPTKQSSMFGNFASALRLRPKRTNHTPAVREPPKVLSPLIIPPSDPVEPYGPLTSRPFSKAVSAVTVTDEGSIEPKTPLDMGLSYQKSLVDADPFAATSGLSFSSPKESQDLEQLFVPPDVKPTKNSSVSSRTAFRRPHTANPQPIRERLVSESTVPSRRPVANRPTLTVRWVIYTRSNRLPITHSHIRTVGHHRIYIVCGLIHERARCPRATAPPPPQSPPVQPPPRRPRLMVARRAKVPTGLDRTLGRGA